MLDKMVARERYYVISQDEKEPLLGASEPKRKNDLKLKKEMSMLGATGLLLSLMVGNGIFISPVGITRHVGSVGLSLVIWTTCGVINTLCALCYAELGAMLPEAGGDYIYMYVGLGPMAAFTNMWLVVFAISPCNVAILARTMALYFIEPLGIACRLDIETLLAILISVAFAALNSMSVRTALKIQNMFGLTKIVALSIIVLIGVVRLSMGYTNNFETAMEGSNYDVVSMGTGVFLGYYAFFGWGDTFAMTGEMKNPGRDLPRAIWVSMVTVSAVFVGANIAYFSVLTPHQMLASDATVLSFVRLSVGGWAVWPMSLLVALSCAGSVGAILMTIARQLLAAGKRQQLPYICCMISDAYLSPMPGIIILCALSILYTFIRDLESMLTYLVVTEQIRIFLTIVSLLVMRRTKPHIKRPYKVNVFMVTVLLGALLVIGFFSVYNSPVTAGVGLLIYLLGIPVYYVMIFIRNKTSVNSFMDRMTVILQKVLMVVPETS